MICKTIMLEVPYEKYDCKKTGKPATLNTYILKDYPHNHVVKMRPAIIICPGGGYEHVSEREAEPIAIQFNAMGYHAFVLDYSVKKEAVYPAPMLELAKAILTVRENAEKWHIDKNKILVCGFSAGGHLAAYLGLCYEEPYLSEAFGISTDELRPDGMILSYPVITSGEYAHRESFENLLGDRYQELVESVSLEKRVTKNAPQAFLWTTMTDDAVPVENSLMLISAYRKAEVSMEAHIFPAGGHGMSLCTEETSVRPDKFDINEACQAWISLVRKWMEKF